MSLLQRHDGVVSSFAEEVGADGPVAVEGHRTCWHVGGSPHDGARLLRAPAGIVEHHADEMTVTVLAGTPVEELHAELTAAGQRTALPERGGTVGGALAVGHNDHRLLGRGRLRACVLQVRYVTAEGRIASGGAATVKNVTGFDLPRLMVGALGTLGLLAEVVLRTNPIPPSTAWLRCDDADPFAVRDVLARPSAILWDGASCWVQLEGHPADVEAERRALTSVGCFEEVADGPALPPARWSLRPRQLRELDSATLGRFVACIGVGLVFAEHRQPPRPVDPAALALAQQVKDRFDPTGRLNPGRRPDLTGVGER